MQEHIKQLLPLTFQGEDDDTVKQASNSLFEMQKSDDFLGSLISLIIDEKQDAIKLSALSYLHSNILNKWDILEETAKFLIFSKISDIIQSTKDSMIPTVSHLLRELFKNTISRGEWFGVVQVMQSSITIPDNRDMLILARSFLGFMKSDIVVSDIFTSFILFFADNTSCIMTNTSDKYLYLLYHCMFRVLMQNRVQINIECVNPCFFEKLLLLGTQTMDRFLIYQALKFITLFVSRYSSEINIDIVLIVYNIIKPLHSISLETRSRF